MTTPNPNDSEESKPAPKRVGRKRILDERKKKDFCLIVAAGCPRTRAAAYIGCSPHTITREARRDSQFATDLLQAEVRQEVALLTAVQNAARAASGWRAAAWLLERIYPDTYGKRRAGTLTREQVATVVGQFADILTRGIRNPQDRRKVDAELKLLTCSLTEAAVGEQS